MKAPHKLKSLCVVFVVPCLLLPAGAQNQPSDDAALAVLIKNYYAAYAQKDLGALVRLWSERSPDLAASIDEAQKTLAVEDYGFSGVVVSPARVSGNKAILQVSSNATISNIQTRTAREERSIRNFALIKEGADWKVWRDAPASQDLSAFLEKGSEWKVSRDTIEQFANALVAARNEEERNKLLADNKQMMTIELSNALIRRVGARQTVPGHEAALRILQIALAVADRAADREGLAIAQRAMGDALREAGRLAPALEHYQKALAGFEAIGNKSDRAATLVTIGDTQFARTNDDLAIESYSKALAEYEALKNTRATANTLESLASVYYDREKYDRALELFERCLKLRETFAGQAEIAATLNSIGNVYFQQQEYDLAMQRYLKALAGFEALKDEGLKDMDAVVSTMSNIASVAYAQGNADTAIDYYQRALKLQETLRSRYVAANLRLNIATVYSSQGNYGPALDNLQKAVAVFDALRDKNKTAGALSDIGQAYFQLRSYNLALEHYQKSVQLYEQLNSLADTSMKLYAIGNVHFAMGNFDLAIESYQKALGQFEAIKHAPGVASLLASIAGTYYAEQKHDLALDFYQKSLASYEALGDRARAAGVVERIASVYYSLGDYIHSLEWAARAVSMAEQVASPETLWRARLTQGFAYRALNQIDEAQRSVSQSIAIIESIRNKLVRGEQDAQHFFQVKNSAYLAMMELLIAQNKVPEAFAYAERIRTNTLLDILQRAQITKTMTAAEHEQERKSQNVVASLKARINHERERKRPDEARLKNLHERLQKALEDYREFEARLYAAHPRLKTLRGEVEQIKLEDASGLAPDFATALLEFVVADTKTYLFVLTRSGAGRRSPAVRAQTPAYVLNAYVISIGRGQLAERVARLRELIARKNEDIQQAARELHDLLLAPASGQLNGKTAWLIVPDDALWQLPFETLQSADNHYLVEDHAIAYALPLIGLGEMSKPRAGAGGVRLLTAGLFANPLISKQTVERVRLSGREKLDPSPETESEVKSLEQVYGAARTMVYIGAQASEEVLKQEAGKFGVIHFAVPALLVDAIPLYSHVALSHSEENGSEDGLLEAWEIMKLDLKADLVVFSASDTATERTSAGDAIIGLAWSLFVAGCPTSVVSRWRRDSAATNALMTEFHRELQSTLSAKSKSRALQLATLKLLRGIQYRHPFYWAGFALVGSSR